MIPIKLTLRNFMCYRDNVPPINFEGIHTACISGNNGNGKSALIDAITWALWGETRANSADDLIHAGQSEVEVDFEFAVGTQKYRIIRKHSKPKTARSSGQTILEFQMAAPEGYKVLTGISTTETQNKITGILHMDYDTFINSAFLRQGHADEFTKKRPGERKQVLANILQLSVYDELEEKARDLAREHESACAQLETDLKRLQEELSNQPAYQAEFDRSQNESQQLEIQLKVKESVLNKLRQEKDLLEHKKAQLAELTAHARDGQRNYALWNEQAQQYRSRIAAHEALIAQRSLIEDNHRLYLDARKQLQDLDQKFRQVSMLAQAQHKLELAVMKAGEELNSQHAVAENRIRSLEESAQKLNDLQKDLKATEAQLRNLDESEVLLQKKQDRSKELRAQSQYLRAEKARLAQAAVETEEKLKLLSHKSGGPCTCPLCESELGEDGQKRIEAKYLAEKAALIEAAKANHIELAGKEAELRSLEPEILQAQAKLRLGQESAQTGRGTLNQAIMQAREAAAKLEDERKYLDAIEQRLARREFAESEQESLSRLEKDLVNIGYDPRRHDLLKSQAADFEKHAEPKRQLDEAEILILQEREAETKAGAMAQELRLKIDSDNQRIGALAGELNSSSRLTADLGQAESEYQSLQIQHQRLGQLEGGAKAKLERLAALAIQKAEKEAGLAAASRQEKIYKDLSQVFGKKGIQAMLIEMALPEIEAEANKLLSRMTDNRMHVKMETQRETKKGDVLETLDINISDELGTRNYEMFSGGEAFRIDFAVRIALSKLLARRAGAPLPTLIIDEGFGTQDSIGIEKIKEAITSIQDDFEKILVITHISDFKDAFPVRIEVVKTPEGSTLYLN